ncbi:unnamed protein product, partial [Rotaria sordida]
MLMERE